MAKTTLVLAQIDVATTSAGLQWWEGLLAGLAGVIVMTVMMRIAMSVGMTSMQMPAILGSMVTRDPGRARPLGLSMHVMNGVLFGLLYAVVWWAIEPDISNAWWIGATFGALHGGIAAVMMPMMSAMHPRVDQHRTEPDYEGTVALPPFGFGGRCFGASTPMGLIMAHVIFGTVWGLLFWALVG